MSGTNSDTTCRICDQPKAAHLFCCRACWQRLPHELRAPFAIAKLKALAWLREHIAARGEIAKAANKL